MSTDYYVISTYTLLCILTYAVIVILNLYYCTDSLFIKNDEPANIERFNIQENSEYTEMRALV